MKPEYVFVVGCFRSGTTLLAKILDSSDEISFLWAETRFLGGFLRSGFRHFIRSFGDLSKDVNVRRLVESIYSDAGNNKRGSYGWLRAHVNQEDFFRRLLQSDRSDESIFKIMLDLHAAMHCTDKPILGEKTPSHVFHVSTLLEWFPKAKVIHIIRDPRAVLVSQLNRKRGYVVKKYENPPMKYLNPLFVFLEVIHVTAVWLRGASLHFKYEKLYPQNYHLITYEDLIKKPANTISQLCDYLEITFSQEMLDQRVIGSSFTEKYAGEYGFNAQAINRWKAHIKPWMRIWIQLFAWNYLKKFGY
ncbi:MAG: sulfotransferase [Desulfobulbaceae bacterium]|nr:sulfotransferase [Desulfobulbaceae bacterium]